MNHNLIKTINSIHFLTRLYEVVATLLWNWNVTVGLLCNISPCTEALMQNLTILKCSWEV